MTASPNDSGAVAATSSKAEVGRPDIEPATYTVHDLAQLLNCSERHVWRQLDLKRLPGVIRCGRLVRFSRRAIDEWLSGKR